MMQTVVIGIAAGVATALLVASVASGSPIAIALFNLAPLPIMIAALGWNHVAGLVAALVAAAGLSAVLGASTTVSLIFFLGFLISVGLPAWWLGYLTLLARPGPSGAPDDLEWYPPGRIVVWAALLGAFMIFTAIPNIGLDSESFRAGLRRGFERLLRVQAGIPADAPLRLPGVSDTGRLLDVMAVVIPPAAAMLSMLSSLANLYLAGRIVKVSGRLKRPWPDISAMTFPGYAPGLLAAAIAATFLPDLIGVGAGILTVTLLLAYALLGLAVLHSITLGIKSRGLMLGGVYLSIPLLGWSVLVLSLLGLAETLSSIRARFAHKRGPPAAST
jgi:hypothetical protein